MKLVSVVMAILLMAIFAGILAETGIAKVAPQPAGNIAVTSTVKPTATASPTATATASPTATATVSPTATATVSPTVVTTSTTPVKKSSLSPGISQNSCCLSINAVPIEADMIADNYTYNIIVNNTGSTKGNYTLSVSDSDTTNFSSSVLGTTKMEIDGGSGANTSLMVSVKTGAIIGAIDITTVNVTSVENPIYNDSIQVRSLYHNAGNSCNNCHQGVHANGNGPKKIVSKTSTPVKSSSITPNAVALNTNMVATNVIGNITLTASMGQDWFQQGIYGPTGGSFGVGKSWGWTFFDEIPRPSGYIVPSENVTQKNNIYAFLLDDGNNSNPISGAQVVANVTYWTYDGTNYTTNFSSIILNEDANHRGFYSGSFYFYGGTPYATTGNMSNSCDGCHFSIYTHNGVDNLIGYFPGRYTVQVVADASGKETTKNIGFDTTPWGCEDCHGSGNQHKVTADMNSACYACHIINDVSGMGDAGNPHLNRAHRNINCTDCHTNKSLNQQTFNGVTFVNGGMFNQPIPQYNYDTISLSKGTHSSLTCNDCHKNLTLPSPQGGYNSGNYNVNDIVNDYNPSFSAIQSFQDYYVINVDQGGPLNISLNWEGTARLGFYLYPPGFNPRNNTNLSYNDGSTFGAKPETHNDNTPVAGQWIIQIHGYDLSNNPSEWRWYGTLQPPINYTISSSYPIQKIGLPSIPECNNCHNPGATGVTHTKFDIPGWNNPGFAHNDTNGDGIFDIQCRSCHDSIHNISIRDCHNCHTTAPTNHPIKEPQFSQKSLSQCLACHGDPHNVSVTGSADCVGCHDVIAGGAPYLINASAMNSTDSIHKNLNSGAVTLLNPENKKCWACHGNGSEPTKHPDNYKNPYTCTDCHAGSNTNFTPNDTILIVNQHYWNGSQIITPGVSSCYQCHNKSEMMIFANSPDNGSGIINGGANAGNNSTSHYGKKRLDLVSVNDTRQYCDYCHNSTTSPSNAFNDVFTDINNRSIQNHTRLGTNPKCQDCHLTGRIHNSTLNFTALILPTSTICLPCHGPGGTANINGKNKHNDTVNCSVCHLDNRKGIHPIKYLNSTGQFTQNKTNGVKCDNCHETGLYGAPAIGKINHSTNPWNGSLWNASRPSIFWDNTSLFTVCIYCHGDSKHNTSALGKPATFKGSNIKNVYGDWCGICHYQTNGQYNTMLNILIPEIPPEISKNSTYGNYVQARDGTSYFNHSLNTYNDNDCKKCHYTGTPSNLTQLMHNAQIGGTSCLGCHTIQGTDYYIDTTTFGKHANVSKSDGNMVVSDSDCKGCHFNVIRLDQMQIGYANYTNTYFCQDCHTSSGRNPAQYANITDTTLQKTAMPPGHAQNKCQQCHIAGDNVSRTLGFTYHPNGPKGTAAGKNCFSCHYRSDGTGTGGATVGLNDKPFNAPGEDHGCNLCHSGSARPSLSECDYCHTNLDNHNIATGDHFYAAISISNIVIASPVNVGNISTVNATISNKYVQVVRAQYRINDSTNKIIIRDWTEMNASDGDFNSRGEDATGNIYTTGLAGNYTVLVRGMVSGSKWAPSGGINHNGGKPYYPDNGVWTNNVTVNLLVIAPTISNIILTPATPASGQVMNITVQINNPGNAFNGLVEGNVFPPNNTNIYLGAKTLTIPNGISTVTLCCTSGNSTYRTSEQGTYHYNAFLENLDKNQNYLNATDSRIGVPFSVIGPTISNVTLTPLTPYSGQVMNITVQINNPGNAFNGLVEGNVFPPNNTNIYLGAKTLTIPNGVSSVTLCCTSGNSTYRTSEQGTYHYNAFLENLDKNQNYLNATDSRIGVPFNVIAVPNATISNIILTPATPASGQVMNITVQINNPGNAFNGLVEGNVFPPNNTNIYLGAKTLTIPNGVSSVTLCCTSGNSTYRTSEQGTYHYNAFLENLDKNQNYLNATDSKTWIPFNVGP